jgi:hypothetical protein
MHWIHIPGTEIEISTEPVTFQDYEVFARQTGHHLPHHSGKAGEAATGVSAHDAEDYARWLSEKESWQYRLPTLDEMCKLAHLEAGQADWLGWPAAGSEHPSPDQDCLEEWIAGSPVRRGVSGDLLHPVTHPLWLIGNHGRVPCAEIADVPYWFVTFRLVRQAKNQIDLR